MLLAVLQPMLRSYPLRAGGQSLLAAGAIYPQPSALQALHKEAAVPSARPRAYTPLQVAAYVRKTLEALVKPLSMTATRAPSMPSAPVHNPRHPPPRTGAAATNRSAILTELTRPLRQDVASADRRSAPQRRPLPCDPHAAGHAGPAPPRSPSPSAPSERKAAPPERRTGHATALPDRLRAAPALAMAEALGAPCAQALPAPLLPRHPPRPSALPIAERAGSGSELAASAARVQAARAAVQALPTPEAFVGSFDHAELARLRPVRDTEASEASAATDADGSGEDAGDYSQGSAAWHRARKRRLTASNIAKVTGLLPRCDLGRSRNPQARDGVPFVVTSA